MNKLEKHVNYDVYIQNKDNIVVVTRRFVPSVFLLCLLSACSHSIVVFTCIVYVLLSVLFLYYFLFSCLYFLVLFLIFCFLFFFFNDTATTEIYTLSLHDALPI